MLPSLGEIRERTALSLATLPAQFKEIENPAEYPVRTSDRLRDIRRHAMSLHANGSKANTTS